MGDPLNQMYRTLPLLVILCLTTSAVAQDMDTSRTATARVLFEEGLQYADEGSWQRAIERFRQTISLRDSAAVRYNLAQALIQVGDLVEASEEFNHIINAPDTTQEVRQAAAEAITEIIPRLARLHIHLEGDLQDGEIRLDGRVLDIALLNIPVVCNPGLHRILISREGSEIEAREVEAVGGRMVEVRFHIAQPTATTAALGAVAPHEPTPIVRRWWFWTVIGVVIAGGVTAGVLANRSPPMPYIGDLNPGRVVFE